MIGVGMKGQRNFIKRQEKNYLEVGLVTIKLRDFADKHGWNVGYTPASGTDERGGPINPAFVSVQSGTGMNIGFQQGQGGQYGVGDFRNDSHYVTDQDLLMRLMTMNPPKTDPASGKAPYEYENKFLTDENIQKRFEAIDKQFSYDPHRDEFLQRAQGQAKDAVMKYYAQHGLAAGSKMQARMQGEAQNLVPQYEQQAYGRHIDERQNQYNMLAQKAQLEGINYQQYQDLQRYEVEQYGTQLSPEMRQHISMYQSMDEQTRRDLDNLYGKDYHAEINRRRNIDPNDPLIPVLEAARANKVLRDPSLFAKYGSQYGFSSSAIAERAANYKTQMETARGIELDNKIREIEVKYGEEIKKSELKLLQQAIEKGDYDNAMLAIKAANYPQMMELDLLQMAANLQSTYANTEATRVGMQEKKDEIASKERLRGLELDNALKELKIDKAGLDLDWLEQRIKKGEYDLALKEIDLKYKDATMAAKLKDAVNKAKAAEGKLSGEKPATTPVSVYDAMMRASSNNTEEIATVLHKNPDLLTKEYGLTSAEADKVRKMVYDSNYKKVKESYKKLSPEATLSMLTNDYKRLRVILGHAGYDKLKDEILNPEKGTTGSAKDYVE